MDWGFFTSTTKEITIGPNEGGKSRSQMNITTKIKNVVQFQHSPNPGATKEVVDLLLEHLISADDADFVPEVTSGNGDFVPLEELDAPQTLGAQKKTAEWLNEFVDEEEEKEILSNAQQQQVANAFAALTTNSPDAKNQLLSLTVPEEIVNAVAMVSGYQWEFVKQANELRSMSVAKIVKETEHPDARIRLKALELLGKVTEVALFTDRVEIKKTELSDEELEKQIRDKLSKYMGKVDIVDVEEVGVVKKPQSNADEWI